MPRIFQKFTTGVTLMEGGATSALDIVVPFWWVGVLAVPQKNRLLACVRGFFEHISL